MNKTEVGVETRDMAENEHLLLSSRSCVAKNFGDEISRLEEHINNQSTGKCCPIRLQPHCENVTIEKQLIYMVDLWTLAEERQIVKRTRAFNGNETCSNKPEGDIWKDYLYKPPETTKLDRPDLQITQDLDKTQRLEECPKCQDNKHSKCLYCKDRREVLAWSQLHVKWSNAHSSFRYYNPQSTYPQTLDTKTVNKIKCLDFDGEWPSTNTNLDSILDTRDRLPEELRSEINNKFIVQRKSDTILRLKCSIERFRIETITYQLNGLPNERFTFYLIGEEKNLHVINSSYPSSVQRYKTSCSIL